MNYQQNLGEAPNNDSIEITLTSTSGLKLVLLLQKNTKFSEMIRKYMDRILLPFKHIEVEDLIFIYNAQKIDPFSNEPISSKFKNYSVNVTVIDKNNIIGL